jgi:hypothetical protein
MNYPSEPVRRRPIFGMASTVFAVLAIILPVIAVGLFAAEQQDKPDPSGWGWLGAVIVAIALAVAVIGICALGGTIAGAIALIRRERYLWLAIVGLTLNGSLLLLLAGSFILGSNN